MVAFSKFSVAATFATLIGSGIAHPGEIYNLNEVTRQVKARDFMAAESTDSPALS
jgi:hypothetical protein